MNQAHLRYQVSLRTRENSGWNNRAQIKRPTNDTIADILTVPLPIYLTICDVSWNFYTDMLSEWECCK